LQGGRQGIIRLRVVQVNKERMYAVDKDEFSVLFAENQVLDGGELGVVFQKKVFYTF